MFDGYKTYIAAGAAVGIAVCTNLIEWCNNQPINIEVTVAALTALALIFLRKGIKKEG